MDYTIKTMTTAAERKKIAEWVLTTKDEILLTQIKTLTLSKVNTIRGVIEDYNREIDEAVEQVRDGKFKTHEEVEAFLKTWESK